MGAHDELLEQLRQEEEELQFEQFSNDTAYELGIRLVAVAKQEHKAVTVDICRSRQQLFHCALPGTSIDNDEWIRRKNRVVERFAHSSYYMGILYKSKGTTIQDSSLLDPGTYAAHGGAFPITIKNVGVVGTITVSGLPQEEDHRLVVQVLQEFLHPAL